MELSVRISKRALLLVGAILAVLAGAAAARLLPTEYTGTLTTGDAAPQNLYSETALGTYALAATAALALYVAVVCMAQVRRTSRRTTG